MLRSIQQLRKEFHIDPGSPLWRRLASLPSPKKTMNAIIIYDECDLALKANAMLRRVANRAGQNQWHVKPWRVDYLYSLSNAVLALEDAAEANLIVFASRNKTGVPPVMLAWLEHWAESRAVQDAAIALFDGESNTTLSGPIAFDLSEFADRHGLSLIAGDINPTEDKSDVFAHDLQLRAKPMSPAIIFMAPQHACAVHHSHGPGHSHTHHRGWGIND